MKQLVLLVLAFSFSTALFAQNVGVGISTPLYRLHVHGGDFFLNSSLGNLLIGYPGGDNKWAFSTTNGGADLLLRSEIPAGTRTTRLYFSQGGNVGIGANSPDAALQIVTTGNTSATNALLIKNSSGDTIFRQRNDGHVALGLGGNLFGRYLNLKGGINIYEDEATYSGSIFSDASGNMTIWQPSKNVSIQPPFFGGAGTVTIGTTTPATGYKLSVVGKVICEELKVQLNGSWPDYVFDSKYALLPLDELEKKVMEQKHLPGILPASTVELNNGFELGDMQIRVVEKVEEMYRYMFDMNRENKLLKVKVEELSQKLDQLQK